MELFLKIQLTLPSLLNGLYLFYLHPLNFTEYFEMHCKNFDMQVKVVVCNCFVIKFPSCFWLIKQPFKTNITWIWKITWFSTLLKKFFLELFIMCLLLKRYNKNYCIESVIWLHCKSFIPYIVYSNKPRKRYVLDTRAFFAKISVIYTTLIPSFTWVVYGLFTELERCNCWLSRFILWHLFSM